MENEKLLKRVKSLFLGFVSNEGWNVDSFGITNISVEKYEKKCVITFELNRPGLLIGRAGRTLNELIEYLSDILEMRVEINIKESDLWLNLYT